MTVLFTCRCHFLPACNIFKCDEAYRHPTCSRCLKGSLHETCMLLHDTLHMAFTYASQYNPHMQEHFNLHHTCLSLSHSTCMFQTMYQHVLRLYLCPGMPIALVHKRPILLLHPSVHSTIYIMQHHYHPNLSTEHVEAPQAYQEYNLDTVLVLTPANNALSQEHLNDFQNADKSAHEFILERVMGQLCQTRSPSASFDKKDARKVLFKPN